MPLPMMVAKATMGLGGCEGKEIQNDHDDDGHAGHAGQQVLQDPLDVKALALLHRSGHTVGTAQADQGVAHVKEAGGHIAQGAQEILGEGHGEGADVVAGDIQNAEGLGLLALLFIDQGA